MRKPYGVLPIANLSSELLSLVKTGEVYSLSCPIHPNTPYAPTTSPFSMRRNHRHEKFVVDGTFGEATEILTMSSHTATHIEALCHVSEKSHGQALLYGDVRAAEVESGTGFSELGMEQCPPIITRGVLLDVPRSKGLDVLPDSYGITEQDLEAGCQMAGVEIRPGDCVLIRTGFFKYRDKAQDRFASVGAGPTPATCRWLAGKGTILTGSDTMTFEQVPSAHLGHLELIRRRGISIIKQANLEEIAADQLYEFLLIVLPLKLVGATASPVNPIAIC
ncbi:MAG: cyclase family protein [Acidobacteria bacterium]|nr:cyclase family protein [Acidobacteriota bacterium]